MSNINKKKKAIDIFRSYGIPLTGKRKTANFFHELHMDKIFVDGLIFELELELEKIIESEKLHKLESPSMVLEELFAAV
ncbi:acyl carrier protein [Fontibacter flavus]|uniref:Acyl carrier protein n=1 Tax=Fontibacter flavus TaxID=654838 RepID=A0ABV6FNE1_9BACT|nr:acyl carrier protein [Cyclobacteriaceae bacterium]